MLSFLNVVVVAAVRLQSIAFDLRMCERASMRPCIRTYVQAYDMCVFVQHERFTVLGHM